MTEQSANSGRTLRGLRRPSRGADGAALAALARAHFALDAGWIVSVAELTCQVPGCPPVETVVLMWDAGGTAYRLRVFRPLAQVKITDFPPRWYLPALIATGDADCGCC